MSTENKESGPHETWPELVSNVRLGKSGFETALHKPLFILLLLARARRGDSNRVSFPEIEEALTSAIHRFGPAEHPGEAQLPFWHLKNDGFWVIENEGTFPLQPDKNRPTKGTLIEYNVTGYVPLPLWYPLTQSKQLIAQLAAQVVDTYWNRPEERQAVLQHFGLPLSDGTETDGDAA